MVRRVGGGKGCCASQRRRAPQKKKVSNTVFTTKKRKGQEKWTDAGEALSVWEKGTVVGKGPLLWTFHIDGRHLGRKKNHPMLQGEKILMTLKRSRNQGHLSGFRGGNDLAAKSLKRKKKKKKKQSQKHTKCENHSQSPESMGKGEKKVVIGRCQGAAIERGKLG